MTEDRNATPRDFVTGTVSPMISSSAGPVLDASPTPRCWPATSRSSTRRVASSVRRPWRAGTPGSPGSCRSLASVPRAGRLPEFDLDGHTILFRTIGRADGALATVRARAGACARSAPATSVYNKASSGGRLWNSTPDSRETGWRRWTRWGRPPGVDDHRRARGADAPRQRDRVLDPVAATSRSSNRRGHVGPPRELFEEMLARVPHCTAKFGTPLLAASSQFPS